MSPYESVPNLFYTFELKSNFNFIKILYFPYLLYPLKYIFFTVLSHNKFYGGELMATKTRIFFNNDKVLDSNEKRSIENKYIDNLQQEKDAALNLCKTLSETTKNKDDIIHDLRASNQKKDDIISKLQSICGSGVGTANGNK